MGDGRRRWVRDRSVRDLSARQRGIRIDLEGDGDQRQAEDDAKDFMVGICRARSRPNRSNISTKLGNTLEQVPMLVYLCLRCVSLLVPHHSDYDWLIFNQSRMGKSSGA